MVVQGDCYRRAYYYAVYGSTDGPGDVSEDPDEAPSYDPDRVLVHGVVQAPDGHPLAGRRIAHAWVEKGDVVFNVGSLATSVVMPYTRAEFDEFFKVDRSECVTYTPDEASFALLRTGHFGPWRD